MIARLVRFARDDRGSVTIELALIAPVLALMVVGITDVSIAYGRKLEIEQAAQRAIEKVQQTTGDSTVAETIEEEAVCQVNGTNEDGTCAEGRISTANVTVTYRLECVGDDGSRTATTSEDATTFDALECDSDKTDERYMSVTVTDSYTPMFPIHFGTGSDGHYDLSATAGMRTQ
jgi:Flp pilus assembly protein TadG